MRKINLTGKGLSGEYYILNKDEIIGTFEWQEVVDGILIPKFIKKTERLPYFIADSLVNWLESRTPPKHREHMQRLLEKINAKTTKDVIDFSKGLSLTDTFWVTNDLTQNWVGVNLFINDFDDVISHIAFGTGLHGGQISSTSPEFGTSGVLPKCWVRDRGTKKIFLKKGGTTGGANTGNEPYSEVLCSQVLDALEYEHVTYHLESFRGRIVSSCPLLTSELTMMVPLHMLCNTNSIESIFEFCKNNNMLEDLCKMFIFDYLLANSDRHGGNLSVLLDTDTYDIKGLAPIYDNGCGALTYFMPNHDNLTRYLNEHKPRLYADYVDMAKLCKGLLKNQHNVGRLINFKFDRTKVRGYSGKKIDIIEEFLQDRVHGFLTW